MSGLSNTDELLNAALASLDETPELDVGGDDADAEYDAKAVIISKPPAAGKKTSGSGGRMKQVGILPTARVAKHFLFGGATGPYAHCALSTDKLLFEDSRNLVRSGPASAVSLWIGDDKKRRVELHSTSPMALASENQTLTHTGYTVNMTTRRLLPNYTAYNTKDSSKVLAGCNEMQTFQIDFFRPTRVPKSGDIASGICVPLGQLADLIRMTEMELESTIQPDQVAELTLNIDVVSAAGASNASKRIKVVGIEGVLQALMMINIPAEYQIQVRGPAGMTKIALPTCTLGSLPHSAFVHYIFLIADAVRMEFSNSNGAMQTMQMEFKQLSAQNAQLKAENEKLKAQAVNARDSMSLALAGLISNVAKNAEDKKMLQCAPVAYYLRSISAALNGNPVRGMTREEKEITFACIPVCASFRKPAGSGGSGGSTSAAAIKSASTPKMPAVASAAAADAQMSDVLPSGTGLQSPYPKH